jgi:hypothetical protein
MGFSTYSTTGNGCSGSMKETCKTGHSLTRVWIVEKSYWPGMGVSDSYLHKVKVGVWEWL